MPRAIWNDTVIAETDTFETVEGNIYFPPDSIKKQYFKESSHETLCPWKGTAGYFNVEVNGQTNPNAAWIYRDPKPAAMNIKDHIAFWKGVKVEP